MATAKTEKVVRGYLALSTDEQRDVADVIRRHQQGGPARESVRKDFGAGTTRLETGPITGGCPCCGR